MSEKGAAALVGSLVILAGYKKGSLDLTGAVAGLLVGWITSAAGAAYTIILVSFFASSSILTRLGSKKKKKVEIDFKEGGKRNWIQVLANGGVGTSLCLCVLLQYGLQPFCFRSRPVWFGFLASYAAMTGDTWASELGVLSRSPPRLIIKPWQAVPPGTNGGLSALGTAASMLGGLFIGTVAALIEWQCQLPAASVLEVVQASTVAGLMGSLIDSLLGSTLQFSGLDTKTGTIVEQPGPGVKQISGVPVLNNHAVNFVSCLLTATLFYWSYQ